MRTLIVAAWMSAVYGLNVLGSAFTDALNQIDWSQVGWAFAGSSAYVLWEIVGPSPKVRNGYHRAALIFIGMVVSLACTQWATTKSGLPIEMVSTGLAALGYKLFTIGQKRADKPSQLLKDIDNLNDEKQTEKP